MLAARDDAYQALLKQQRPCSLQRLPRFIALSTLYCPMYACYD